MEPFVEGGKERVALSFTEDNRYLVELYPVDFWDEFAKGYGALVWDEQSADRLAIVAVNYTYLLNLLILARDYYLKKRA